MLSFCMSYDELFRFAAVIQERGNSTVLSTYEKKCITQSFQTNPFLKELVKRYPLIPAFQRALKRTEAMEQIAARERQVDNHGRQGPLGVHDAAFGSGRTKTQNWLRTFSGKTSLEVICTDVQRLLDSGEFDSQLNTAETCRYEERCKELGTRAAARKTLPQVKEDFSCYLAHLQKLERRGSTYGQAVILNIHAFIGSRESPEERKDAQALLVQGLDDGRTGYHAYERKFFEGTDYSCPQGAEERLLDAYTPLREHLIEESPTAIATCVSTLTESFVIEASSGRRISPAFYQLYLEAMGYQWDNSIQTKWELKNPEDLNPAQELYIRKKISEEKASRQLDSAQKHHFEQVFLREFNGLLNNPEPDENGIFMGLSFKSQQVKYEGWVLSRGSATEEEIRAALLTRNIFIDNADLYTIESLFSHAPLDEVRSHIVDNTRPENLLQEGQKPMVFASLEEKHEAYNLALESSRYIFFPYSHPRLDTLLQGASRLQSLPCSQMTLVHFIRNRDNILTPERVRELGVFCAKSGYVNALRDLIDMRGLPLDYWDSQERQFLFQIAGHDDGHMELARALIEKGSEIHMIGQYGKAALTWAVINDKTQQMALTLISKWANIHANGIHAKNSAGRTALMAAGLRGHTELVLALIENGADIHAKNSEGNTALIATALGGHTDLVLALIKNGADIHAKNNNGDTALMTAAIHGHTDPALALIENGADIQAKNINGDTALMAAAIHGHTELALALIENGADIQTNDIDGGTALMAAVLHGHTELALALIKNGADIHTNDIDGDTALMAAALHGHTELALALIKNGADIHAKNNNGTTVLMAACLNAMYLQDRNLELISALIEKAAGVSVKNDLDLAALLRLHGQINAYGFRSEPKFPQIRNLLIQQERTQMSLASIHAFFGKLSLFSKIQYALGELSFQDDNERIIESFLDGEKNYLPCTIEELKKALDKRETLTIKQVELVKHYLLAHGEKKFCECLELKMNKNNLSFRPIIPSFFHDAGHKKKQLSSPFLRVTKNLKTIRQKRTPR